MVTKLVPEFSAASKVVVALQLLLSGYQVAYAGTIMLVVTSFMDTLVEMMGEIFVYRPKETASQMVFCSKRLRG